MIGFNHAAVGGLLAVTLPLPLAVPLAFASHFLLDILPHYGIPPNRRNSSVVWRTVSIIDFVAAWVVIGGMALVWGRYDIIICGLVAASPDFTWVARIIYARSFDLDYTKNATRFTHWHARIQLYERPWGIWIELPLAVVLFYCLQRAAT